MTPHPQRTFRKPGHSRLRIRPLPAALVLGLSLAAIPVASFAAGPDHGSRPTATATTTASAVLPKLDCTALTGLDLTTVKDAPSRILSAAPITVGGFGYCDVKGYTEPQTQFELRLPTATWHGQYVQNGCGGYCGDIPAPTPAASTGCGAVNDGELVIGSDDEGHLGQSRLDGLWGADDPELRTVFAYTSEHSLAQVAKAVIGQYYGRGPAYSYFDGCSDGGREALMEAQRYPDDFDGVLAGAPALDATDFAGMLETWVYRSNTDARGQQILGVDKLPALHAAVMKACAGSDGLIDDPRACAFDPASIQCPDAADSASCLTAAQVTVVRDFYTGPVDQKGRNLYPGGLPYGSELGWAGWDVAAANDAHSALTTTAAQFAINYLKYLAFPDNPPGSFTLQDFAFTDANFAKLQARAGEYDSTDPDLSAFQRHGGKLILYHGAADQAIPPFGTIGYYQAVAEDAGGFTASQAFSRMYLIPAQYHCLASGTPQATGDLLTPLMSWVEDGRAPAAITLQTVSPTAGQPTSITVPPLDPTVKVVASGHSLNDGYHWLGHFGQDRP